MILEKMISQHCNDFWATFRCEHCGHVTGEQSGYLDNNFFVNVIPGWYCEKCERNRAGDVNPESVLGEQEQPDDGPVTPLVVDVNEVFDRR